MCGQAQCTYFAAAKAAEGVGRSGLGGIYLDLEALQHALNAAGDQADAVHDRRLPQIAPARARRCIRATHGLLCGGVHPCMHTQCFSAESVPL